MYICTLKINKLTRVIWSRIGIHGFQISTGDYLNINIAQVLV